MPGKLIEQVKQVSMVSPVARTSAVTLYNGVAATTISFLDTAGYGDLVLTLDVGTCGAASSVAVTVVESDATDPSAATAITDAAFTTISDANALAIQKGYIKVKNAKQYVWLKTVQANTTSTIFGCVANLGEPKSAPVGNSAVFDIDLNT